MSKGKASSYSPFPIPLLMSASEKKLMLWHKTWLLPLLGKARQYV